jgi:hypothetical protein
MLAEKSWQLSLAQEGKRPKGAEEGKWTSREQRLSEICGEQWAESTVAFYHKIPKYFDPGIRSSFAALAESILSILFQPFFSNNGTVTTTIQHNSSQFIIVHHNSS